MPINFHSHEHYCDPTFHVLSTLLFLSLFLNVWICFRPKRRHVVSFIKPICRESCIEITNVFALLQKQACLFIYKLHMDVFPLLNCAQWSWWICKPSGYVLSQKFIGEMRIKSHRITAWKITANMPSVCNMADRWHPQQVEYTYSPMSFGSG